MTEADGTQVEVAVEESKLDINERLVESWAKEKAGNNACQTMADMLGGIVSLKGQEETKPLYNSLVERGFDEFRMMYLIGEGCQLIPPVVEEPRVEVVSIEPTEAVTSETEE